MDNKMKNKLTIGILAHVDAGKTTLSEAMLYLTGSIRKMGRVDHKDAFLDTFELEKNRGITIFSKQAVFVLGDKQITLLDTPGHVDFSSEMERTLQVLDYAILLINGADGIQGHTVTLWRLLENYQIPTLIFVNKMDQIGTNKDYLLKELQDRFSEECIDFNMNTNWDIVVESIAVSDEKLLELFLEKGKLTTEEIIQSIQKRKVFPVLFGSALKIEGIQELLDTMKTYFSPQKYSKIFGARVFNISRDEQNNRLTHVKVTGGTLRVKDLFQNEKVDQIRIYSGKQYELQQSVVAGTVCSLTGLLKTQSGDGLGFEKSMISPLIKPVLSYCISLPKECSVQEMMTNLRQLEEEEPHLNIIWNEFLQEIHVQVMGEIEIEILKSMILERYGVEVEFDKGSLVYKETIQESVIGIGHFEPLRHYAEVHLLLEPGELGSGMIFDTKCSVDILAKNWQQLILTHLREKKHQGVLTGSILTDMKVTVVGGRAHLKHTEGGDFRQATYRAIRQGLMKTTLTLLEPMYRFRLELPHEYLGRAISDISRMYGRHENPIMEEEFTILNGVVPVATMMHYAMEVNGYTRGEGRLSLSVSDYEPCHNSQEVFEKIQYDPEKDLENISSSVFCNKGVGYHVPWNQVDRYKHAESQFNIRKKEVENSKIYNQEIESLGVLGITEQEVDDIFLRTYGPGKDKTLTRGKIVSGQKNKASENSMVSANSHHTDSESFYDKYRKSQVREKKDRYLLVDGYNIIFSWEELSPLVHEHMDLARSKLINILSNYKSQAYDTIILVFDAYRVQEGIGSTNKHDNIYVVYTKEAETADQYIERLVSSISPEYDVTVATSDMVEQVIIMGQGAKRLSSEGLRVEVNTVNQMLNEYYISQEKAITQRLKFDINKKS